MKEKKGWAWVVDVLVASGKRWDDDVVYHDYKWLGESKQYLSLAALAARWGWPRHEVARAYGALERPRAFDTERATWRAMLSRCGNPRSTSYPAYGARGIKVCERWKVYANFYADMGRKPSGSHTLDRIDNDGDYEPANCRWATKSEQARNQRRAHWFEFEGQRVHVKELEDRFGIATASILKRVEKGWTIEQAVSVRPYSQPGTH